jgi:hypothetical protein
MNSGLEEAKVQKNYATMDIDRATRERNDVDFERLRNKALPRLTKAIDFLKTDDEQAKDGKYKDELRQELADCYGMMGGVYRRLSQDPRLSADAVKAYLEDSEKMYKIGYDFAVDDSYNLSNLVVIPILINPERLDEYKPFIEDSRVKIEALVRGKRKYDWWAWTDLGLFNLLVCDYPSAKAAYEQATQLGARSPNYKSTISVLEQLKKALSTAKSPTAKSVALSGELIVNFLKEKEAKIKEELKEKI